MHSKLLGSLLALFTLGHAHADLNHSSTNAKVIDSTINLRPIIAFNDLTQEKIDLFFKEIEHFIIDCPAGTKLPLSLSLSGDFFALETGNIDQTLTLLKHCYVTYRNSEMLVSTDLGQWKPLHEFTSGRISALFNADQGKPQASVTCEINEKK